MLILTNLLVLLLQNALGDKLFLFQKLMTHAMELAQMMMQVVVLILTLFVNSM